LAISTQKNTVNKIKGGKLLASVMSLRISPRPDNFNWKEDYADALKEKYANIH